MTAQHQFDVIIIGTGAGGGTLARKLASSGKRILLLERGGYVPREKDNWNPRVVNLEGKYNTKDLLERLRAPAGQRHHRGTAAAEPMTLTSPTASGRE